MKAYAHNLHGLLVLALALLLALALSACSARKGGGGEDGRTTTEDGGQHGGGGHVLLSSSEEVHKAIEQALALAKQPDLRNNVIYTVLDDLLHVNGRIHFEEFANLQIDPNDQNLQLPAAYQPGTVFLPESSLSEGIRERPWSIRKEVPNPELQTDVLSPDMYKILAITFQIRNGGELKCSPYFNTSVPADCGKNPLNRALPKDVPYTSYFVDLLNKSPIEIRESGDCGRPSDDHAVGSVEDFRPGAKICLSVEQLRRVAPSELVKEVLALLFHETAHLNGYGEHVAQTVQVFFWAKYEIKFERNRVRDIDDDFKKELSVFETIPWEICSDYPQGDSEATWPQGWNPQRRAKDEVVLVRIFERLTRLPFRNDPVGMQVKLHTSSPEAALGYVNELNDFMKSFSPLTTTLDLTNDHADNPTWETAVDGIFLRDRQSVCDELKWRTQSLRNNFQLVLYPNVKGGHGFCRQFDASGNPLGRDYKVQLNPWTTRTRTEHMDWRYIPLCTWGPEKYAVGPEAP